MTSRDIMMDLAKLILPVLTYFAGLLRGKRMREEDRRRHEEEREADLLRQDQAELQRQREAVLDRYRSLHHSGRSSGIPGLIAAGALALPSSDEVRELCRSIDLERLPPGIPRERMVQLEDCDLLQFLQKTQERRVEGLSTHVLDCIVREVQANEQVTPHSPGA